MGEHLKEHYPRLIPSTVEVVVYLCDWNRANQGPQDILDTSVREVDTQDDEPKLET